MYNSNQRSNDRPQSNAKKRNYTPIIVEKHENCCCLPFCCGVLFTLVILSLLTLLIVALAYNKNFTDKKITQSFPEYALENFNNNIESFLGIYEIKFN